ncbi:MAG TPA: hypothetical protein VF618_16900 [Thermoanaerobaculia bacterium]
MSFPPVPPTTMVDGSATAAVDPPEGPPTLTITQYQRLATDLLAQLILVADSIPKLEAATALTKDYVRRRQGVPMEFLEAAVAAVQLTPELRAINKLDPLVAHDTLQFLVAFRPVLDQLASLHKALKFTMATKRAALTSDALQIYQIAKGVARDARSPVVFSHVENMKRDYHRGRSRKKADPEEQEVTKTQTLLAA